MSVRAKMALFESKTAEHQTGTGKEVRTKHQGAATPATVAVTPDLTTCSPPRRRRPLSSLDTPATKSTPEGEVPLNKVLAKRFERSDNSCERTPWSGPSSTGAEVTPASAVTVTPSLLGRPITRRFQTPTVSWDAKIIKSAGTILQRSRGNDDSLRTDAPPPQTMSRYAKILSQRHELDREQLIEVIEEMGQDHAEKDEQLKSLDEKLANIQMGLAEIDKERHFLTTKAKRLESEKEALQKDLAMREKEIMTLSKRCIDHAVKEQEIRKLQGVNKKLVRESEQLQCAAERRYDEETVKHLLERELEEARQKQSELQQRLECIKKENVNVKQKLQECQVTIDRLNKEKTSWEEEKKRLLKDADIELDQQRLGHVQETIKLLEESEDKLKEYKKLVHQKNLTIKSLEQQLSDSREAAVPDREQLEAEVEEKLSESFHQFVIADLESRHERDLSKLQNQLVELHEQTRVKILERDETIHALREQLSKSESRLVNQLEQTKEFRAELADNRAKLNDEMVSMKSNRDPAPQKHKQSVHETNRLVERLQSQLSDSREYAAKLEQRNEKLVSTHKEEITNLKLSQQNVLSEMKEKLTSSVQEVDHMRANQESNAKKDQQIDSLQKQLFETMETYEMEKKEANRQLDCMKRDHEKAVEELKQLHQLELSSLQTKLNERLEKNKGSEVAKDETIRLIEHNINGKDELIASLQKQLDGSVEKFRVHELKAKFEFDRKISMYQAAVKGAHRTSRKELTTLQEVGSKHLQGRCTVEKETSAEIFALDRSAEEKNQLTGSLEKQLNKAKEVLETHEQQAKSLLNETESKHRTALMAMQRNFEDALAQHHKKVTVDNDVLVSFRQQNNEKERIIRVSQSQIMESEQRLASQQREAKFGLIRRVASLEAARKGMEKVYIRELAAFEEQLKKVVEERDSLIVTLESHLAESSERLVSQQSEAKLDLHRRIASLKAANIGMEKEELRELAAIQEQLENEVEERNSQTISLEFQVVELGERLKSQELESKIQLHHRAAGLEAAKMGLERNFQRKLSALHEKFESEVEERDNRIVSLDSQLTESGEQLASQERESHRRLSALQEEVDNNTSESTRLVESLESQLLDARDRLKSQQHEAKLALDHRVSSLEAAKEGMRMQYKLELTSLQKLFESESQELLSTIGKKNSVIETLQKSVREKDAQIESFKERLSAVVEKLDRKERELEALESKLKRVEKVKECDLQSVQEQLNQLQLTVEEKNNMLKSIEKELAESHESLQSLRRDHDEYKTNTEKDHHAELTALRETLEGTISKHGIIIDEMTADIQKLQSKICEKEKMIESLQIQLSVSTSEQEASKLDLEQKLAVLAEEHEADLNEMINAHKQAVTALKKELDDAIASRLFLFAEKDENIQMLQQKVKEQEQQLAILQQQFSEVEENLTMERKLAQAEQDRIFGLSSSYQVATEEAANRHESELSALRKTLEESIATHERSVAEYEKMVQEANRKVESQLKIIASMRKNLSETETQHHLEALELQEALNSQTNEHAKAIEALKKKHELEVTSLTSKLEKTLSQHQNEIREKERTISGLQTQITEIKAVVAESSEVKRTLQQQMNELTASQQMTVAKLQEEHANEASLLHSELEKVEGDVHEKKESISQLEGQLEELQLSAANTLKALETKHRIEIQSLSTRYSDERKKCELQISDAEQSLAQKDEDLKSMRVFLLATKGSYEDRLRDMERHFNERIQAISRSHREETEKLQSKYEKQLSELTDKVMEKQSMITSMKRGMLSQMEDMMIASSCLQKMADDGDELENLAADVEALQHERCKLLDTVLEKDTEIAELSAKILKLELEMELLKSHENDPNPLAADVAVLRKERDILQKKLLSLEEVRRKRASQKDERIRQLEAKNNSLSRELDAVRSSGGELVLDKEDEFSQAQVMEWKEKLDELNRLLSSERNLRDIAQADLNATQSRLNAVDFDFVFQVMQLQRENADLRKRIAELEALREVTNKSRRFPLLRGGNGGRSKIEG